MNELVRGGRDVAERVHVRHHVVAEAALVHGHRLEVDVVEVRAHLRERFVRNGHAEPLLRLREREPEPAPEPVPHLRRPQLQHRLRGVALGERRRVAVVRRHRITKSVENSWPSRSQIRRIGPRPA